MRYKAVFLMLFSLFLSTAKANWVKIGDVNYTWGPFNIYHITLFTETGSYTEGTRPLMLTLQYKKPWAGRDFAVSLARTWKNLDIKLPEKEIDEIITNLRKTFPDIKPEDRLHYIALEDKGYFILNDKIVSDTFNKEFSDAIAAIWLDPKMDISHRLLDPSYNPEPKNDVVEQATSQDSQATLQKDTTQENNVVADKPDAVPVTQNVVENVEAQAETSHNVANANVTEANEKDETKVENKEESPKEIKLENPEVFISPIYDDFFMLSKNYI